MGTEAVYHDSVPLDEADRRLLDTLQRAVPLCARPYEALARDMHRSEQDILARLERIRSLDMVSRIAAIFDTRRLGYESVLVAARYNSDDLDHAAAIINEHPGVSHNYLRTAAYNLWYTLAVPPDSRLGLNKTVAMLSARSHAAEYRLLPATRVYKIGVRLALAHKGPSGPATAVHRPEEPAGIFLATSPALKAAILALQEDLPATSRPFDEIAGRHGLDVPALLTAAQDLLNRGVMRRYAAVLRHRNVGFGVNCMTVWNVPQPDADRIGRVLAGFAEVTHCYLRPAWPDWPYNLYAMIHCRSDQQCNDLIERMRVATGLSAMQAVYSTKEYKKVRLQYFSPAFAEWESRFAG